MILFATHTFLLSCLSYFIIKLLVPERKNFEGVIFTYLIFWSNILLTSFILSFLHILNSRSLYFSISILIQFIIFIILFKKNSGLKFAIPRIRFPNFRFDLFSISFAFLCIVFLLQIIICICYIPLTPDTLSNKLVKIYAYLQNDTLLPNPDFDGGLLFISPLNTAVTWMYFVVYRVPYKILHFFSLFNWVIVGLSSYALCKKLKISSLGALIATVFLLCSDSFLLNSTGDNDDLIGASSFIMAVLAFLYWYMDRRISFIIFSGLALGINLGIKPFAVMYYSLILLLILFLIFKYKLKPSFLFFKKYFLHGLFFIITVLTMLSGVFYENYKVRENPLAFSKVLNSLRNSPFDIKAAGINLTTQNMELFLSPLLVPTGINSREVLSEKANALAKNLINKVFKTDQAEVNSKYSAHANMTTIASGLFYDHSVNFGFYPHLLILFGLSGFLFFKSDTLNPVVFILGLSFLFADLGYCMHNKYIATIMRYWMIIFTITTPLIGYTFDIRRKFSSILVRQTILIIFLIHFSYLIFTAIYGLFNNYYRSIGAILTDNYIKSYSDFVSVRVSNTLPKVKKFNLVYIHNYGNALIHNIAPESVILSKHQIQESIPNIKISLTARLGVEEYSRTNRILNVSVDELTEDYFVYLGDVFGAKFFMNRLPKELEISTDKKDVLFYISQPSSVNDKESAAYSGLVANFKEVDSYECSYYRITAEDKEEQITPWSNFLDISFKFLKSDKSIRIKVRSKKTQKIFYGSYDI